MKDEEHYSSHSVTVNPSQNLKENEEEKDEKNKIGSNKIIDEYIIKETIGKGTFSTVKLGENIKTKQKVAIKILNKDKIKEEEDLVRIKREIKILSVMDHPNVIKTYKNIENDKNYYLIMEYCDGGELFNYIVEKEKLDEDEASMFFYQLINALEYIHSLGIAHRDLKPENLLLVKNKLIKIIDFGLSNYFDGETKLETPCGSPSYASPEIIKGELYNGFCIDVWASGIIMFAMLCGYLPFDDDDDEDEEKEEDEEEEEGENDEETNSKKKPNSAKISSGSRSGSDSNDSEKSEDNEIMFQKILSGKLDYPSELSDYAVDLMKKILVVDPKKRIEIKDIKKHKFYLLGQKNYLLNQKNISKDTISLEPLKNDNIDDKINKEKDKDKNKDISNNNDKNSKENKNEDKNENIINKNDEVKVKTIEDNNKKDIKKQVDQNKENKNVVKKEVKKEVVKKDIKDEMEEYEKKLYENYLRKAINIQKNTSFTNKKRKENIVNKVKEKSKEKSREKSKEKEKKNEKNNINININKVNIVNINPIRSMMDKNLKKFSKNKNNYTLNEIILDFNPNTIEANKQTVVSSSKRFNTNNNLFNQYRVPLKKINPILKKNFDYSLNSNNISNSNMHFYNENNKNINPNVFTISNQDITLRRRNNTENKLLKNINFITHANYNKEEQNNKYYNFPKLKSIDQQHDSSRIKYNKPFLPIIKTSLYNLFANNSINQNKDTSYSSSIMKTESSTNDTRKRLIYFGKNNFTKLRNNTDHLMSNEFRYKIFNNNYKKLHFSDFNSIH